jgi:signal transduction histidine kinase
VAELGWIVGLGALLGAIAVATAAMLAVFEEVDELMDDTLQASAEGLAPLISALPAPAPESAPTIHQAGHVAWVLLDAQGKVRQQSSGMDASPLLAQAPRVGFSDLPEWRVYGQAVGPDGHMLLVAQTREERREASGEVALYAGLAGLGVALVLMPVLLARARRALLPLDTLSQRLASSDGNPLTLGQALGPPERRELAPIHEALDGLGQRLAQRLQFERAFAAQAAHLLRTPLAGMDAQLAVAVREHPELPRLAQVRAATTRLQRLVLALLRLFRSAPELQRKPLDARQLLGELMLQGLVLDEGPSVPLNADAELLAAALLNLLDNAQRHGARHVRLQAFGANGFCVQDDGPGVTDVERRAILAALDSNTDHDHRLGLRLADLVARAHGGRLNLPPTPDGEGFTVQLDLAA